MLPEPQHRPSLLFEAAVRVPVAIHVPAQLVHPPLPVRRRYRHVLWTRVPEAAIDEHRNLSSGEQQISTSACHSGQRGVDPVPESSAVRLPTQDHFGRGVPTARATHLFGNPLAGWDRTVHRFAPFRTRHEPPLYGIVGVAE